MHCASTWEVPGLLWDRCAPIAVATQRQIFGVRLRETMQKIMLRVQFCPHRGSPSEYIWCYFCWRRHWVALLVNVIEIVVELGAYVFSLRSWPQALWSHIDQNHYFELKTVDTFLNHPITILVGLDFHFWKCKLETKYTHKHIACNTFFWIFSCQPWHVCHDKMTKNKENLFSCEDYGCEMCMIQSWRSAICLHQCYIT